MASLPPPVAPSSLVKVSRWSLLVLGVVYGATRYETLKKREDAFRAKEEAERPAREAALLAEKKKKNEEEMKYLAEQAGVKTSMKASDIPYERPFNPCQNDCCKPR